MLRALLICVLAALPLMPAARAEMADRRFVIFFHEWSAQFDDAAAGAVAEAATWAQQHPDVTVTVTGYADPTGSVRANELISELRAERVYDALLEAGIPHDRVRRTGLGKTDFQITSLESRRVEISFAAK